MKTQNYFLKLITPLITLALVVYIVFTCWDGMNLAQLRDLVLSITPVRTLYVLDGGNSAQMIFLKSQINRDDNENGNGRAIQDIIYFASAYFAEE